MNVKNKITSDVIITSCVCDVKPPIRGSQSHITYHTCGGGNG